MGALNRGELVAGVADEHAGLPDGPIADRDALDELGDRARRRSAHRSPCRQSVRRCTSQQPLSPPSNQSWLPAAVCLHKCSQQQLLFFIIYHLGE